MKHKNPCLIKELKWAEQQTDLSVLVIRHKDKWISPALNAFIELLYEETFETP